MENCNNFDIVSQKYHSPNKIDWSEGIFQTFTPVSGDFKIDNSGNQTKFCFNNGTGRGFNANPCGYYNVETPCGKKENLYRHSEKPICYRFKYPPGALFPESCAGIPQDRVWHSFKRIGEIIKNE